MSIVAEKPTSAQDAVEAAFREFRGFFGKEKISNTLLEALDFDERDNEWIVKIGFDVGRTAIKKPSMNAFASLLADEEITPVREIRTFVLDGDTCSLKRISS